MVWITLPYFSFHSDTQFLITKQKEYGIWIWRTAFYVHVTASLIVIPAGILQYNKKFLQGKIALHRLSGKIYAWTVLGLSAPSGLIMAFHANGGWAAKISFIILSILWWTFTYYGIIKIREKNYSQHYMLMTISYALALSAITLRLYSLILPWISDLRGVQAYVTLAWTSWVPNLIIAAWFVKKNKATDFMGSPQSNL